MNVRDTPGCRLNTARSPNGDPAARIANKRGTKEFFILLLNVLKRKKIPSMREERNRELPGSKNKRRWKDKDSFNESMAAL